MALGDHFGSDIGYKVLLYLKKNKNLQGYRENGILKQIEEKYMQAISETGYLKKYPHHKIFVEFDKHENVKQNYGGNYFVRDRD